MSKRTIVAPESKTKRVELTETMSESETPQAYERLSAHRRSLAKYDSRNQFTTPVEELAQDNLFISSVYFPGAELEYPDVHQALFRFVSRVYPNAKGGPLYVDLPRNENETYRAYERQKVMKRLKYRHVIVERDTSLVDLLEQLGEM